MFAVRSPATLLAVACVACSGLLGCLSPDVADLNEASEQPLDGLTGSVRLQLEVGDVNVTSVTAVISGRNGFVTQTHTIDVAGDSGVVSIFFGSIPAGRGYAIALEAGPCHGSTTFEVVANQITIVPVVLDCGAAEEGSEESGSVQITGSLINTGTSACNHISKIVAAPSIQDGQGPVPRIELVLDSGVTATAITWTSASPNGGGGTIGALVGDVDREITFDCSADGTVSVVAEVTALEGTRSCSEEARVALQCVNQGGGLPPRCGDGALNQPAEQCDGRAFRPNLPAGSLCAANCTVTPPSNPCGNGIINPGEQCDGAVLPAGVPPGISCSPACTLLLLASCGDGAINQSIEQCDGAALPAGAPAGSSCSATCLLVAPSSCGDNIISLPTEECDGTAIPTSAPAGSTCANCRLVPPPVATSPCATCAQANCAVSRATVDANLSATDALLDCVLGSDWPESPRVSASSCANGDLLACYCGTSTAQSCATAAPASLNGACVSQILAATACTTSNCVASSFSNTANANGKAIQYVQCRQESCFDECFAQ